MQLLSSINQFILKTEADSLKTHGKKKRGVYFSNDPSSYFYGGEIKRMRNKKGEANIGVLLTVAIAVIVGLVLLQASAPNVTTLTTTSSNTNKSYTLPANGASIALDGQAVSNVVVLNRTGATYQVVPSNNYTISNYGATGASLTINDATFASKTANITYTYEPIGYSTDAGGRTVSGLILLFGALAIAFIAYLAINKEVFDY